MKKLTVLQLTAIALSLSVINIQAVEQLTVDYNQIDNYLNSNNIQCENMEHIEVKTVYNFEVYDLTCKNKGNYKIYSYVPEQITLTHHIQF